MAKHYIGEIGTDFLFDCGVSVSDATVQQIWYKKPDGSVQGSWGGSLYDSYSESAGLTGTYYVKYTTAVGDLDVGGLWEFQSYIATAAGTWWGETVQETIYDKFE